MKKISHEEWVRDWKEAIDLLDHLEKKVAFAWVKLDELAASCPSREIWDQHKSLLGGRKA